MRYRIGVDLGGTHIGVGLINQNRQLVGKYYAETPEGREFEATVQAMIKAIEHLLKEQGVSIADCDSVGIGSPGVAEEETGKIVFSTNFQWYDKPLGERLKQHFSIPVHVGNDADVAGWAEFLMGAGRGHKSCITITLGTGVGGGLVLNGHLFSGGMLGGAELGHVTLVAGGVKALYAETLSLPALTLLANAGICTRYGKLAPFILNRTKTGWCPLENLCQWESNPEELIRTIRRFVRQQGLSPAAGEVREEEKSYSEND